MSITNTVIVYSQIDKISLEAESWSTIFSSLDTETLAKIQSQLDALKEVAETEDEKVPEDPTAAIAELTKKITKLTKGLKSHRSRFNRIENRLEMMEKNRANDLLQMAQIAPRRQRKATDDYVASVSPQASPSPEQRGFSTAPKRGRRKKLKTMNKEVEVKDDTLRARKHFYMFGTRKLQMLKPTEGYPTKKEAQRPVEGALELFYSHGYSVVVVMDYQARTQQFFTRHNDDITTICCSPKKTWIASGQKDPKDEPGQGKDLPKIWIWNYNTMKPVQLIDNVCWGKIGRLQWSKATNTLYCICGDPEQTLKAYDPDDFKGKKQPNSMISVTTMKEQILGFVINDRPNKAFFDEFIIYGKRKFCHCGVKKSTGSGKKLTAKVKGVSITSFRKDGEKYFGCALWMKDGKYLVGAKSGAIYVGRQSECLQVIGTAHDKSVGCLKLAGKYVLSAGFDRKLKQWRINRETSKEEAVTPDDTPAITSSKSVSSRRRGHSPSKSKGNNASKTPQLKGMAKSAAHSKRNSQPPPINALGLLDESLGGNGKVLEQTWSYEVNMADTDYILQPRAMAYNKSTGTLFVGSKTNQIMKFEMKEEEADVIVDGHDGATWGLCTHPDLPLFATGGYDNAVKIWDATTMKCIITHEFELEQGVKKGHQISCGHWCNSGSVLAFGTENTSMIFIFQLDVEHQLLTLQQSIEIPPKTRFAEREPVSYLRFSADGETLAAAHMDGNLYIYTIDQSPGRVVAQQWPSPLAHIAAPTCVQFSEDGRMIKTLTRDYEVAHWVLDHDKHKGKFFAAVPDPDKLQWADDPLIAGWDVEGLYQKGWDGTDLNDASLTADHRLIASGDDYGKVRLHNYPSTDNKTCAVYGGHAEFVVGIEFLRDDSQLITTGGADMAIFQWKLHKKEE